MKLTVDEHRNIVLEQVFTTIEFKTVDGEKFSICMRDSGYEFKYNGKWYEAKEGTLREIDL